MVGGLESVEFGKKQLQPAPTLESVEFGNKQLTYMLESAESGRLYIKIKPSLGLYSFSTMI
jgi:hypothetical protein